MPINKVQKITHSVLCVTYNQESYIEKAITSLFSGRVWPDEVIILDDCSTDKTRELISNLLLQYPNNIKVIYNPKNLGLYGNFNQLIGLPSCDMVHLCSGDDWIEPGIFEKMNQEIMLRALDPRSESFCIMPNGYVFRNDRMLLQSNHGVKIESFFKATLRGSIWYTWVGMSRKYFDKFPKFDANFGIWADYYHALNFSLQCENLYLLDEAFPVYRAGVGISTKTSLQEQSASFLKVVDAVLSDFESHLDTGDFRFLCYQIKKHQAVLHPGVVKLTSFFWQYLINIFNGAKRVDVRITTSAYLRHIFK